MSRFLELSRAGLAALLLVAIPGRGGAAESTAPVTPSTAPVVIKNQGFLPFADAPINYRSADLRDPVAKLEKRLERGELKLHYDSRHGYLKSVLDALHISASSQALVFSKTSFQYPEINPSAPRALYYNDDVYVGQVHDGRFLEFVSFDPMQGAIFYVMDEHRDKHPRFERSEVDCIQCHVAPSTKGIPGVMLRSVFTKPDGSPNAAERSFVTGQESAFGQRWGGWYVTARNGVRDSMANQESLAEHVDAKSYLDASSDIVALMVLAHQTQMHNWMTLTNYQSRIALANPKLSAEDVRKKVEVPAEQLVRYLLFTNEIPLQNPIAGTSGFARQFAARGPRDSQGRSLRDFDLQKRIFKYPCSYLIYSEAFDAIPPPAKEYIYRRLFDILSGREQGPEFASLSSQDRRAILEILVATKPGLPAEWKQEARKPLVQQAHQGLDSRASFGRLKSNRKRNTKGRSRIMQNLWRSKHLVGFAAIALAASVPALAQTINLDGRWDAGITQKGGTVIPFRLDIAGSSGGHLVATLHNGANDTETTTSASFQNGVLTLEFQHYLTDIQATVKDGDLDGKIIVTRRSAINITPGRLAEAPGDVSTPFHAKRYVAPSAEAVAKVPNIDGVWEMPHESPKGEKSWRLIVQQNGADIETTVLRVDGDTGGLTGAWQDGKFVASHFDGARPGLIEITPQADGTLSVNLKAEPRNEVLTAYRPEVARAKGLPEPANYLTHTTVRNPDEVLAYSFRDVDGKIESNNDPKFKGKVVLAIVTGTWCPNCHDEAKYLVQLYKQYHAKGVEIVALDFEEADQQESLTRVKAFIKQYDIPYTYLIAGTPDEMWDKVPQAVNLNTWPATLFIGRDGKVKATYSGFASAASGVYNKELKDDFTSIVDRLLAGDSVQSSASLATPAANVASR